LHIVLCGALTLGWGSFPALGVAGPALALVVSFTLAGMVLTACVFTGKAGGLRIRPNTTRLRAEHFHEILKVGVVASLNALLTIATVFIITRLVATQGTAALAGYGLGSRLELLLVPLTFGIGAALTASVGANFGARNYARARRVAMTGAGVVFVLTGAIGVTASLAPELWLAHFSADPGVHAVGAKYLQIVGPWYGFFGLGMALYFASQGTGNMLWPLGAGALRLLVAAGGAAVAGTWLGLAVDAIFVCVACGLLVFGVTVAASLKARHWNPEKRRAA
jgi:Na+-driven multidrug efflux pump